MIYTHVFRDRRFCSQLCLNVSYIQLSVVPVKQKLQQFRTTGLRGNSLHYRFIFLKNLFDVTMTPWWRHWNKLFIHNFLCGFYAIKEQFKSKFKAILVKDTCLRIPEIYKKKFQLSLTLYTRYPIVARALGLAAAVQPLGRVRRASKGILHAKSYSFIKIFAIEVSAFLKK